MARGFSRSRTKPTPLARFAVLAMCAVLGATTLVTATADGAAAPIALTPEQAVRFRRISELTFSPDGSQLVCVASQPHGKSPESHLWRLDVRRGELRQLTFSVKSERAPQWAPDGNALAFLSNRSGRMQVYVLRGNDTTAVTDHPEPVSLFRWSPDGARIAFLAKSPKTELEKAHEANGDDAKVADREENLERLWITDLGSKRARQVTAGSWRILAFAWLNDERLIATATNEPFVEAWNAALWQIDVASGTFTRFATPPQPFDGLWVSPGRARLAYAATRTGGPIAHDLFVQELRGGSPRNRTAELDRPVLETHWQSDDVAVVRVTDGFDSRLFRVPASGRPVPLRLPLEVRSFDVTRDGTIAFVGVAFDRLPELFLASSSGRVRQVSHLQHGWDRIRLANARRFWIDSFDGTRIEAALMTPLARGSRPAHKPPLVTLVHGGPASSFTSDYYWFAAWAQLLATRGFAVLMVNPRGSTGYGESFVKANRADWGGGDYRDILFAIDAVIARGEADSTRLGIGGWSYGGQMTLWAITHGRRFRAAVVGDAVYDLASEFGTEDDPVGDEWYFGTPWTAPETFARNSPATFIRHAATPTLVIHGEDDAVNPVGQAQALYRALKRQPVECQLVTYPREGHLPREEVHQVDILRRMLDWFETHLNR